MLNKLSKSREKIIPWLSDSHRNYWDIIIAAGYPTKLRQLLQFDDVSVGNIKLSPSKKNNVSKFLIFF
jgi:hypothetical protein